jgi:invasion protein IalB
MNPIALGKARSSLAGQMDIREPMIARRLLLSLFLTALAPDVSSAQAQGAQQLLGQFTDWAAYSAAAGNGKVCFAISQPKSRDPAGLNRDPAYFFVSHRPGENVRNEVSVQVGFPLKPGSSVDLAVGTTPFQLVTQEQRGWSNGQDDSRIVEALRGGSTLTVKSTSGRGNVTTDSYSLKGISAALDRIASECR